MAEKIVILDAGAQYGKVIDRRVRELNVESEILPMDTPASVLEQYAAIIISGGPESVYGDGAPEYDPGLFDVGIPILGICYGMQLMNHASGGKVERKLTRNDADLEVCVETDSLLFSGMDAAQTCMFTHGDSMNIDDLASNYRAIGLTDGIVAAIEDTARRLYGVQFHPEVTRTPNGREILRNFLYRIAGCKGNYTMPNREEQAIRQIREKVGDKKVLVLVSGGVDSTVCAALLHKALGTERVYALHIDNGFMREGESRKVNTALEATGMKLRVVDASQEFYNGRTLLTDGIASRMLNNPLGHKLLSALGYKGLTKMLKEEVRPEAKRKIIGDTFMRVAERIICEMGLVPEDVYLAQGTLRPDLIESASELASTKAAVIKTHHNDTALVRELRKRGRVIEPLKDYHKDEVRELGKSLGLPDDIVMRHPFPGPGLAIRIICAERPYITEEFDGINERLTDYSGNGIEATLLPIQTVGVQGDGRSYSYLVGLSGKRDWDELFRIAKEVPRRIPQVNRLAYIFGEPVKGPIKEITPTHCTPSVIYSLQRADGIVNRLFREHGLMGKISQAPVILAPLPFEEDEGVSIALRTFITDDFMVGRAAIPGKDLPEEALEQIDANLQFELDIGRFLYDLTSKPPGTTEWE